APPRKLDRSIPADLETVVVKALAREPDERYATASELAEDLRRWLADRAITAEPPTRGRRVSKRASRQPAALAAAAAALALGAVTLIAGLFWHNARLRESEGRERSEAARATRERDAAREERRRAQQAVDDMYTRVAEEWLGPRPRLRPLQREFLE